MTMDYPDLVIVRHRDGGILLYGVKPYFKGEAVFVDLMDNGPKVGLAYGGWGLQDIPAEVREKIDTMLGHGNPTPKP